MSQGNSESFGDIVEVSLLVSLEEELQVDWTNESLIAGEVKIEEGIGLSVIDLDNIRVKFHDLLHNIIKLGLITWQDGELVLKAERLVIVNVED